MGVATRSLAGALEGERAAVRRATFLHQDGLMLSTTLAGMEAVGVLAPTFSEQASVAQLLPGVEGSGFGYLRVGFHTLASQGWLDLELTTDPRTTTVRATDAGRAVIPYLDRYLEAAAFLSRFADPTPDAWAKPWDAARRGSFEALVERALAGWGLGDDLGAQRDVVAAHLDGACVVPAMLSLHATGALDENGPALPTGRLGGTIGDLLMHLGWLEQGGERWTKAGERARITSRHYGLAASYLPVLSELSELYRGERSVASSWEDAGSEWHVHRGLNVLASGAAHGRYFADADEVLVELFDREPVSSQPRFVADMGCGDGSWLVRIHELVRERTLRGERLETDPLLMVGLDFNEAALDVARQVLKRAQIPALILPGDISDPDGLRNSLAEHGVAIEDGLHVRSFIDHERQYLGADPSIPATGWPTGTYADRDGHPVDGADAERDLVAHLRCWAPYVRRHGLVILEAHSVPPAVTRHHVGALHSIAFEGYHGYSHQYPIEYAAFIRCCREAGLRPASYCERHYPSTRPFVAVSVNRFLVSQADAPLPAWDPEAKREDTWEPAPGTDLEDGRGLHELLFVDGDLNHPRSWCSAATGWLVAGALERIEARLATARPGDAIRLLDYGTGTGLAAIEVLKASRERGLEDRLQRQGVALEIHLADLPGSWFAKGYELLRGCAWTRFHSLRDSRGGFRPLLEVTGGRPMDVILASMVFHLIPPRALSRIAADLASTLAPGGRLLWNSPDLGPPGRYAVLFHDPNRALRTRWLSLLKSDANGGALDAIPAPLREPLERAREELGAERIAQARERARRRVLPEANLAETVADSLAKHLVGETEQRAYEMLRADFLDALLVPSNQGEYLSEVEDEDTREALIRCLLLDEVLPEMERAPAGTGLGLNVHWTLGSCARPVERTAYGVPG